MLKWSVHHRVRIMRDTSSACDVRYVVCHVLRKNSSAIKFDGVYIAFILPSFYWLRPLTGEGGKETGVPGENA